MIVSTSIIMNTNRNSNYFSQNKNRYMVAYLQHFANNKLQEVHIHYPIPGYSRMPVIEISVGWKRKNGDVIG